MWMGTHSLDFNCIEPLRLGFTYFANMPSFRDRDSGLSQEHGINLDETGEIVELVGCFFWTSAQAWSHFRV